jgi:flagellar biosynthetic protein FlhB
VGAWAGLLVASVVLPMTVKSTMKAAQDLLLGVKGIIEKPDLDQAQRLLVTGLMSSAKAVAPLILGILVTGVVAAAGQGGIRPAFKLVKPSAKKLNPFSGLKKNLGPHALWEAIKALVKTVIIGAVVYSAASKLVPALATAGSVPLQSLVNTVATALVDLMRTVAGAGLAIAAADYAVARRRIGKQLKMSKQDIKDEYKRTEGDPHIKGAIRARQMAMSRQRMMNDLERADVVVVNPVHVAVALRYDPAKGAPRVVAKGAGAIAAKIRQTATERRIPMVQDVPLARALYKSCDLGQEIPAEFYTTVARVLAFVMMLKAKGAAAGTHRNPNAA